MIHAICENFECHNDPHDSKIIHIFISTLQIFMFAVINAIPKMPLRGISTNIIEILWSGNLLQGNGLLISFKLCVTNRWWNKPWVKKYSSALSDAEPPKKTTTKKFNFSVIPYLLITYICLHSGVPASCILDCHLQYLNEFCKQHFTNPFLFFQCGNPIVYKMRSQSCMESTLHNLATKVWLFSWIQYNNQAAIIHGHGKVSEHRTTL